MKSVTILRRASSLATSGAVVCLLLLTACASRPAGQMASKEAGAAATARNDSSAVAANSPTRSSTATTDQPVVSPSQIRNNNRPNVSAPTPQVGTGASDLFLFTQARAALEADVELKAANIVIDVKGGLLTLSGKVANAEQKSKVEQLVRALDGVKAVKNQLRVSTATVEAKASAG
jgi:osmotically-inducible protein OsmY